MALFPLTGVAAGSGSGTQQSLSLGLILLAALFLVLLLFVAGVALLTRARHLRGSGEGPRAPGPDTDAWREAGRRMRIDGDQGGGD